MLLVKTYLDKSELHGIGLFAAEFIPKGTLIWKFVPGFDLALPKKDLDKLPEVAKSCVLHYGYYNEEEEVYVLCIDDARFFNHSETPNTNDPNGKVTIANRDIQEGEEITSNYLELDSDAESKLAKKDEH